MSSKVIYERMLWFHYRVRAGKYPNTRDLAVRFEISRKTAQRDIEFMRERLGAPLRYIHDKRGYTYESTAYEMPGIWIHEDALMCLLISSRLASAIPDQKLKHSLKTYLDKILGFYSTERGVSLERLQQKVSVKNIEYSVINERIFHQILDALLHEKTIRIKYYSPHNDASTKRDILPLHLLHYMGSWHIIAHCALRGEIRNFAVSRIRCLEVSSLNIEQRISDATISDYISKNFGILRSDTTFEVCIRFAARIAPWINELVWHSQQKAFYEPDGSLFLTFPVADFREVKREILKYGSNVEVLSPKALRDEVKDEIEKMSALYE